MVLEDYSVEAVGAVQWMVLDEATITPLDVCKLLWAFEGTFLWIGKIGF